MVSFPYHSHIFRDSYGSGMGIVWEASHKGVPLLGVPGITLQNTTGGRALGLLITASMKALSPRRRAHKTYSTCLQWYTLIAGLLEKSMYTKKGKTCAFVHVNFRVPSNNCHPSQELRPYEGVYQPPFSVHSDDC